jgi:hypothetical protein
MRRSLFGLLLATLAGGAAAAWERVGVADDGMVVYADPATIQKTGDNVKMQALLDYKTAEKDASGKPYLSAKLLHEYECKGERGRTLYFSLHAGQMGSGQLVFSEMRAGSDWRPAGRTIIGETLWNFACKRK